MIQPTFLLVGAFFVSWYLQRHFARRKENPAGLPLPPGPKGYPIIGNILNLPTWKAWQVYDEWFKIYGDMVYLDVMGQGLLILGSQRRTYDLFEKRSSNYSDRPGMPMLGLMGYDYVMGVYPYGSWWRRHRRAFHDFFHPNVIARHGPIQTATSRAFLRNLLESPEDFFSLIRLAFASTVMKIAYGLDVKEMNDPYVSNVEKAMHGLSEGGDPGKFLVNLLPSMKHIPSWFPGASWKRMAESFAALNKKVADAPFELVKKQIVRVPPPSIFSSTLIEGLADRTDLNREEEERISRDICALAYFAGADTTVSSVQSFFLAMCLYQEVQKKAQAELDNVLKGRLPEFKDRPFLPYINALIMETLRWQPIAPLGVPHMATNSDSYGGFFIPKGTIVMGNIWTILHDPENYDKPEEYNPERFLTKDGKLKSDVYIPGTAAFGFGRRVCAGRFLSDTSLFSTIAHVLSVYDIRPGLDDDGREIQIKPEITSGAISYPVPFKCRIIPRSKAAENLIRESEFID
ncbi:O-methylsterigmatocystin oxidoreductase [Leucoagaricus sp. SymC.cos]|nr:O-methylsterigmatocystin oxidoreductase [Leucoagaricus sp. SymC.cos]